MPETCRISWQNKILNTWCILVVICTKITPDILGEWYNIHKYQSNVVSMCKHHNVRCVRDWKGSSTFLNISFRWIREVKFTLPSQWLSIQYQSDRIKGLRGILDLVTHHSFTLLELKLVVQNARSFVLFIDCNAIWRVSFLINFSLALHHPLPKYRAPVYKFNRLGLVKTSIRILACEWRPAQKENWN